MFEIKKHLNLLAFRWLEAPPSPDNCTPDDLERIAASLVESLDRLGVFIYYGHPLPGAMMIEFKDSDASQSWTFCRFRLVDDDSALIAQNIGSALLPDIKGYIGRCYTAAGGWHISLSDYQQLATARVISGDCPASQFSRFFCDSIRIGLQYVNSGALHISLHDPAKNIGLMRTMAEGIVPDFEQIGGALMRAIAPEINTLLELGVYNNPDISLCISTDFAGFERAKPAFFGHSHKDWTIAKWLADVAKFAICGDPE